MQRFLFGNGPSDCHPRCLSYSRPIYNLSCTIFHFSLFSLKQKLNYLSRNWICLMSNYLLHEIHWLEREKCSHYLNQVITSPVVKCINIMNPLYQALRMAEYHCYSIFAQNVYTYSNHKETWNKLRVFYKIIDQFSLKVSWSNK